MHFTARHFTALGRPSIEQDLSAVFVYHHMTDVGGSSTKPAGALLVTTSFNSQPLHAK
jgi:hypothetical protein